MEKAFYTKTKLILFVSAALLLLAAAVYLIGKPKFLFESTYPLHAYFTTVNGLQVGNNVQFAGITVGAVTAIQLESDSSVKVDFELSNTTRPFVKSDSKAAIGSEGLMGNKTLNITYGSSHAQTINADATLEAIVPVLLDDVILKLKITADNCVSISEELQGLLSQIRSGKGTIGKLLNDTSFAESLHSTLIDLKSSSHDLKSTIDYTKQHPLLKGLFKQQPAVKRDTTNTK